jgi:hypothetical protein
MSTHLFLIGAENPALAVAGLNLIVALALVSVSLLLGLAVFSVALLCDRAGDVRPSRQTERWAAP